MSRFGDPDHPGGRPFKHGHHAVHDLAAAGRKGAARSPWRKGNLMTPASLRLREQWNKAGTRRR